MTRKEEKKKARWEYVSKRLANPDFPTYNAEYELEAAFNEGIKCADSSAWRNVKDELPDINREVVALQHMASGSYKVIYAHRPNPNGYVIVDGEKLYAKTYSGWNLPDVEWWLDLDLPFEED